jgi:ATP/maltotriose-dependent transcriptional regulator MalT
MVPEDPSRKFVNPGKFFKPPTGYDMIARERLYAKLQEGSKIPLTLVSAPSGFGKSSLVSSWLDQQRMGYCWLSLEASENSLPVFLKSLIGSMRQRYPDFASYLLQLLNTPNKLPMEQIVSHFNQTLSEIPGDMLIVLDDFHLIRDGEIHQLLYEAFRFPLQHIHLILLTRHDPPWPLLHFRTKGWLLEIRSRDLLFTSEEIRLFFERRKQLSYLSVHIDKILEITEGWPTGVRLLSSGIKDGTDASALKYEAYTKDYFHDLIEKALLDEPSLREFALLMSAFDEFNHELGDHVLKEFAWTEVNPRKVLNQLATENFFVISLDDKDYNFRFHHLIREYLYAQLIKIASNEKVHSLHALGAAWYADHGYPEKALKQYILGKEYEKAVDLFRELSKSYLAQTDWASLQANLKIFPPNLINRIPELQLAQAWSYTYEGEIFEMFSIAADLRSQLWEQSCSDSKLKAEWAVLEAYRQYNLIQDYNNCLELCEYALKHLPPDHSYAMGFAWIFLGGSLQVLKGTSAAVDRIRKGRQATSDFQVISLQLLVLNYLYWMDGNITMLQKSARRLLDVGDRQANLEASANGLYFMGIAKYSTGNLREAESILEDFFKLRFHTIAIIHFMGVAALILCRVHREANILESNTFKSLESFVQQLRHPFYNMFLEAFRTELIWRTGDVARAAERASEIINIPLTPLSNFYSPHLTRIKALISTGLEEDLTRAESGILEVQHLLEATNNFRFRIDLDLLRSQLYSKLGNKDLEKANLSSALKSASAHQIVSPFLEMDDEQYRRLGNNCSASFPRLYQNLDSLRPFNESSEPLVLSPREKQVLALLGRHLSNKEIGNQLNISEKTVKRHTGNLFKKLNVKNRTEAANLVAEFNLS